MNIENNIVEQYQSNEWSRKSILESIQLAKNIIAGQPAYIFSKFKNNETMDTDKFKVTIDFRNLKFIPYYRFLEGWKKADGKPGNYNFIGSFEKEPKEVDFVTLESITGRRSKPYPVPTNAWCNFKLFVLMFTDTGLTFKDSKIVNYDGDRLLKAIERWEHVVSTCGDHVMVTVASYYTETEMDTLRNMARSHIASEIAKLDSILNYKTGKYFSDENQTILTKGLTGPINLNRYCLETRKRFWTEWSNLTGVSLDEYIRTFTIFK